MKKYPNVVSKRADELLESGNQPNAEFAKNKAVHEFNEMIFNLEKLNSDRMSKGEKPGSVEKFKEGLENASVKQYIDIMRRINHMANNLPK